MVTPVHSLALLEREQETALLERAWRAAVVGRGSTWLLCAEAGGGKTRLASEVAAGVGWGRVRWGAAEPVSPPDPYLAMLRALPGFEPAPTRAASVVRAVEALGAAGGPLLLVLDDLHYADEGTAAVLVRLAAECATRPWLILAAFRPGEGTDALREGTVELVAQGAARRLDLAPLSPGAVATLLAEVRRRPVDPDEAAAIYRDSGGNPWFAEALARGNGAVTAARDRITLRLDRLERTDAGALATLRALAPATRPLPYEVVAALHGGDTPILRRTLARLRDAGLLREDDGGWSFRHELLRRLLLDGMITVERREGHRALALALERGASSVGSRESGLHPTHPTPDARRPTPSTRHASAAEVAMHFAEAEDGRAVEWALRAAREAHAVDAHAEALGQYERALRFAAAGEERRTVLAEAAREAYDLGRHAETIRYADEALAIPGGEPEVRAGLHQVAARAARYQGDIAADEAHLAAAARLLDERPPSVQKLNILVARVARAAMDVQPERLAALSEQALRLAASLGDAGAAAEVQVKAFLTVSLLDSGDPGGLSLLDEVLRLAAERGLPPGLRISALGNGYEEAVLSLFHRQAAELYERAVEGMQRHGLDWRGMVLPYRVLELVQRGRYEEARELAGAVEPPAPGTLGHAVLLCATVLREARAGEIARAGALLAIGQPGQDFQSAAFIRLAQLELAMAAGGPGLGELAQGVYAIMNRRRYARIAGVAAVALARSGRGAVAPPGWLAGDAPPWVLWDWAAALDGRNVAALREVAARLSALDCPYEAALALRDAGDLTGAYRAFRAIGAGRAREATAALLRAAGLPVPRRTRAAGAAGGLTDTEREVTRLVATGLGNEEVARALGVSVRTVTTHLTRIYQKTDSEGRTALAVWWTQHGAVQQA